MEVCVCVVLSMVRFNDFVVGYGYFESYWGIYRVNGKEEVLLSQSPAILDSLVQLAKVQSTEASNAIEGIVTTSTRLRQLVADKTTPHNRDEQEIMGYRDALNVIHESYDSISLSWNHILQLHKILYNYQFNARGGQLKSVQNYISATYPDGRTEILFNSASTL